jgi:heme exporter protein D
MNWSEFFSMGGYGFYVWGSYLVTLIVMGGEVVSVTRRRKLTRNQKSGNSVEESDNR